MEMVGQGGLLGGRRRFHVKVNAEGDIMSTHRRHRLMARGAPLKGSGALASMVPVAALFLLASCASTGHDPYFMRAESAANVYVAPGKGFNVGKVAVMPFKAETELIGSSVGDMFTTELLRASRYDVLERSQISRVLSETELALAGVSAAKAIEAGNMLGADGVVIGTVDEYSAVAARGHPYPVVGLSVRMIDCKTGEILWTASLAKRASTRKITLAEHGRSVLHEMMAGLYRKWNKRR